MQIILNKDPIHTRAIHHHHYYNSKKYYKIINGGSIIRIDYKDMISLEFEQVNEDKHIKLLLSNKFNNDNMYGSCITVEIDSKHKIASISSLSTDIFKCFYHDDFILKNPSSFYIKMTIKMLQKYKDKFKINRIELRDNASINIKNGKQYNLSQFKLLTEGLTWYEKYGFKIANKNKEKLKKNKKILSKIKLKNINFDKIFDRATNDIIENNKKLTRKSIYQDFIMNIKNIKIYINKNKDMNFVDFMHFIFIHNKKKINYITYSYIINHLLTEIESKFNYERFYPSKFYMNL